MLYEIRIRLLMGKKITLPWLKKNFKLNEHEAQKVHDMIYEKLPQKKLMWSIGNRK
jgi:hypothetical protein